jgi:phosphate-selective porin
MNTRNWLVALVATAAPLAAVHGLSPPSASDGPVKLLTCVVSAQGILEAEVDSQTEDAMDCNIRCNYELGERRFSQSFSVTIPGRFHGRVGRFDTSNAKAGNYSGDIGTCKKSPG